MEVKITGSPKPMIKQYRPNKNKISTARDGRNRPTRSQPLGEHCPQTDPREEVSASPDPRGGTPAASDPYEKISLRPLRKG